MHQALAAGKQPCLPWSRRSPESTAYFAVEKAPSPHRANGGGFLLPPRGLDARMTQIL
jgi:hypothetical protein